MDALPTRTYTPEDIRRIFNISETALKQWLRRGTIPQPIRFNQRVRRWNADAIDAIVAAGRVES